MNFKNILLLVTVCHLQLTWSQDDDGGGGSADDLGDGGNQVDEKDSDEKGGDFDEKGKVIDYAVLDLKEEMLRGSRWAVEQKKNGTIIEVFHAIEIVDISKVDVETMSIRIEIHLRQRWDADDIQLPTGLFKSDDSNDTFIRTDPKILESLWSPDSFIPIARESKISQLTTEQAVVNIFKNKTIVFKARLYTILGCAFSFQWYPLDKQTCEMTIESYTLTDDMVRYRWEDSQTPVHLADLKLLQLPMQYGNGSAGRWGRSEKYPYVKLIFAFERQLGHHLIQVFIPTILVVILSWFSFWLGMDAIPGRISLLITCMLTLVTMHTGLKGSIPPVNYIKMMDIWMVGCMIIVFLALCEFVVVKYLHWRKQQKIKAETDMDKEMKEFMEKMKDKVIGKEGKTNNIDAKMPFNPYLEFYKNLSNDTNTDSVRGAYPISLVQQRRPAGQQIRPAWEVPTGYDFNRPVMMTLQAEYFNPMQQIKNNPFQNDWGKYPPNMRPPKKRPIWVIIDRVSRVLFPLIFLIFNAIYWPVLIIGANNQ